MTYEVTVISVDFDSGERARKERLDKSVFTIGREASNDIVLKQQDISAKHARVRIEANGDPSKARFFVTDLGSANGTMVENEYLTANQEFEMSAKDRIIIGSYLIKPALIHSQLTSARNDKNVEIRLPNRKPQTPADFSAVFSKDNGDNSEQNDSPVKNIEIELAACPSEQQKKQAEIQALVKQVRADQQTLNQHKVHGQRRVTIAEKNTKGEQSTEDNMEKHEVISTNEATHGKITDNIIEHNFSAIRLFSLKGRVLYRNEPLVAVTIDAGVLGQFETDEQGRFQINDLPEDTAYDISARKDGYALDVEKHSGTLDGNKELTFRATKLVTVRGAITHKGKPLAGVKVECGRYGATITDIAGHYVFENVPEGEKLKVVAQKEGFRFQ